MPETIEETNVTFDKQFERRLQKALEYSRYKERGLTSNPFNIDHSANIWKVKVGRDEELVTGIENLKEMADKNTKMINILGPHGAGKTMYALLLFSLANRFNQDFGFEKILFISNSTEFKEKFVDSSFIEGTNGEILKVAPPMFAELKRASKPVLLFMDDADIIFQDYSKAFTEVAHLSNAFIVAAWNKSAWERAKHRTDTKFPAVEVIMLKRLSDADCSEIIKKRIVEYKMSPRADHLFSDDVVRTLSKLANGSPHRVVRLAKRLLNYMMDESLISIKIGPKFDQFIASIQDITYESLVKRMANLSETQRKIIEEMKKIVEADADKIGSMIGITRVGAMKQLKQLEEAGIVFSLTKNKKKIYQLREEIEYGSDEE